MKRQSCISIVRANIPVLLTLLIAAAEGETRVLDDASLSKKSDACKNPVPDLSEFAAWTADPRAASLDAGLPPAGCDGGGPPAKKALMIGVDGLRAASMVLPLPNFRRLERMGTYSYWAEVQEDAVTKSGPGWASMFTGVQPGKHLVDSNGDLTDISPDYPTVFSLFKNRFPEKKVAASVSWSPLIDSIIDRQDPNALDARFKGSTDDQVHATAKDWILSRKFDFVFVDYDDCDAAGHSHQFDPYLPEYRGAVTKVDAMVGELLDAVLSVSAGEEWLVVLTSDHGGDGYSHGPKTEYNLRVPFMVASNSPRVNIGTMPADDPGSQLDLLPTIMHFFDGGSCADSSYGFKAKGVRGWKDCSWVAEEPEGRCGLKGTSATCPKTCGSCGSCADSPLPFKFRKAETEPLKAGRCARAAGLCGVDGMTDACRETCGGCRPSYDADGQPFGFADYGRTVRERPRCVPDASVCGCDDARQADYRGTLSATAGGRTCQRWDAQSPHEHTRTPDNYPQSGLEENYCRNPDGEAAAWCYTTDKDERWELCDVPSCPKSLSASLPSHSPSMYQSEEKSECIPDTSNCGCEDIKQADYRGTISETASGRTCQRWDTHSPHKHTRTPDNYPQSGLEENYCRNPDGEAAAWCYTTDKDERWEYCNVPSC